MLTDKQEVNWQKGLAFLRNLPEGRQCRGRYSDGEGGYCAWGAIMLGAGWDGESLSSCFLPDNLNIPPGCAGRIRIRNRWETLFGHVVQWNDEDRLAPATIADRIEQYILPVLREREKEGEEAGL